MSACDNSYYRLLFAIRERNKYDLVFERALDELSGKVDFSWVKSCVSMGTGHGTHEISFARRFLPNLKTFVAVDNDLESVKAFWANIQAVFVMFRPRSYLFHTSIHPSIYLHRRTSQGARGDCSPQTRAKTIILRAKANFFGQKPATKSEKNIFGISLY